VRRWLNRLIVIGAVVGATALVVFIAWLVLLFTTTYG
jgi:hypothetical protein